MTALNLIGRVLVDSVTNKSGGALAKGDVVIVDTSNDRAVTTTTTSRSETTVGVVIEENGIASNATGRVQLGGYVPLVNVPSSMTRGNYLETYTVAKQATGSSSRRSGSFGQFASGGTTPAAWLWGSTDQTASGSSSPTHQVAYASGNVDLTPADTFVDLVSLSLLAGTYLLIGTADLQGAGVAGYLTWRLTDGTNVEASDAWYDSVSGGSANTVTLTGWVTPGSTTTWKLQAASQNNHGTAFTTANRNGTTNKAIMLRAIKFA